MRRDHAVAETRIRSAWQREKAIFERQHRANLRNHVETRLALAAENARLSIMREKQLVQAAASARPGLAAQNSKPAHGLDAAAANAAGVWVINPSRATNASQPPPLTQRPLDQAKQVARRSAPGWRFNAPPEVPKRTQQIPTGNGELGGATESSGTPKGLSVFMALLMLHMPSVALASLVTGVFLVRGHRQHSGLFFLALSAVLGVAVIFFLPW